MQPRDFCLFPILLLVMVSCVEVVAPPPEHAAQVRAVLETEPVLSDDDAADDPAIWIHPRDPALSLIIGTDKRSGIEVYNLEGERVQRLEVGRPNNVDLRMLDSGPWSAIAAASNRSENTVSLFVLDQEGVLTWLPDSEIETGLAEPYGLCMYRGEAGIQIFVNGTDGSYQQWLIDELPPGSGADPIRFQARLLREFSVPSQPEGCVADDEHQRLFLGVEAEGVRMVAADHRQPAELYSIADIDGTVLVADVEGMSLYRQGSEGFLVVSSQGNYSYAIYDRLPPFSYRGSFIVVDHQDASLDGGDETDGLDIVSIPLGSRFPEGLLVVQDGINTLPPARQNFKLISWRDIARALSL